MRKYLFCIVILLASLVQGQINLYVYEADGVTPFDYRNIMAGTQLTLIVNSDSNEFWSGGLFIDGNDRAFGTLSARDYDPNTRDYTGSHFEDAGSYAKVTGWKDSDIWGFDMFTFRHTGSSGVESNDTVPGDWFIIDYTAEKAGVCNIGFYDYSISWDDPNYYVSFTQVASRDFNNDGRVNFRDYSILASNWYRTDCNDANGCDSTDLDSDGDVDLMDLAGFIDFWLWPGTEEPEPPLPVDSNIIVRIVDIDDNNEITLDVNESVTLYVRLTTTEQGDISIFDVDVNISDINLGSIDNREYDVDNPNDPNNGTARILASPRDPFFDYVGPSYVQEGGIQLSAASLGASLNDGNLASFVFTCRGQGDVILNLENYLPDIYPNLQPILIHQYDPNSQQMYSMSGGTEFESNQVLDEINTERLVTWLEEIWENDPNINQTIPEEDWNELIESVQNSGESY